MSFLLVFSTAMQAQIVGSNAFLQGNFAEVGVNTCGAFASNGAPPAGYVVTGLSGLNFVADSDMDGWDVGDPAYCGDYAVPGSLVEGWGIEINGISYYNTDQGCFTSDISGEIISYSAEGDSVEVIWEGSVAGVTVTQRSVLYADNLYFVTYVTLTNDSGDDFSDVYYRRNIDPDNEQLASGSFTTINTVESNPSLGDPAAIVTAVGETYGCYLALVANNLFSSASYGNFGTTVGMVSDSYNGLAGYNLEGTNTADEAIQMSFWIPVLPNGTSTTFAFAYVFSEDAVADALDDTFIAGDEAADVGVTSILAPASGCGLGSESVTVNIFNFGFEAQSDIPVSYRLDGGAIVSEVFAGPLEPGTFAAHTFATPADMSAEGDYVIESWTALAGDGELLNDTTDRNISNIPVISTFPYTEDFEGGSGGWFSGGINSTWELGSPGGALIDGPPPGTPGSVNSWATNLFDFYDIAENSWVQSPCFDLTSLSLPYVKFDIWWETGEFWDGARLEYSTDAGATWIPIGGIGTGDNWYTDGGCFAFGFDPISGTYNPAWEGPGGGWVTAQHDIAFLAGEPQVQFRMHMATAGFIGFTDGIAFDNFFVGDPFPNDVGVIAVTSPSSGADLTAAETVTVTVENFGADAQSGFDVAYQVDGGAVVTETFTDLLAPGATASFSFAATIDMSADGDYAICAWTELATDEDVSNDTTCVTRSNLLPVTGTGAWYINSNVPFGEPWGSTSNIDAMNAVFGDDWTQGDFETIDVASVFGASNCFVFLEGSDQHAQELEDFLEDNIALIEAWVSSGGNLFLNAAPNEGDGMSFGFGGTELIYAYFTNNAEAADPGHPIFAGPFTPVGTNWTGGSFGHARIDGDGLTNLIWAEFATTNIVAAEKAFGDGKVIFGGMTTNNFHSPATEAANLRANIIAYLSCSAVEICEAPAEVTLDALTATSATLSWTPVPEADQYVLAIRNNTTGVKATRQLDVTSYTFESLTPGHSYTFRVKSGCFTTIGDISGPSPAVDFTTPLRLGMEESGISVYPNPSNGTFRVQLNGYTNADAQVRIFNTLGQLTYNENISVMDDVTVVEVAMDVEPGTYLVQVISGDEVTIHPIVIE